MEEYLDGYVEFCEHGCQIMNWMLYDDMLPSSVIVIFQLLCYSADRLELNVELYIMAFDWRQVWHFH